MAQFSVPSGDIGSGTGTTGGGGGSQTLAIIDDNPAPPPVPTEFWEALSNPSNDVYVRSVIDQPLGVNGNYTFLSCGTQAIADPGVDTGHSLRVTVRYHGDLGYYLTHGGAWELFFYAGAYPSVAFVTNIFFSTFMVPAPDVWTEVVLPLDPTEVQAWRAGGGYILGGYLEYSTPAGTNGDLPEKIWTFDVSYITLEVPSVTAPWWYSSSTDTYHYGADPGGDFVEASPPAFRAYGQENPVQGVSTGGTPIRIVGDGFADTATVTVGGVAATSIVTVNQHTITCVTPAFGGALSTPRIVNLGNGVFKAANTASATVTVTNPDGSSASI